MRNIFHIILSLILNNGHYLWLQIGNHKLIRWKFVIQAGIDGFSRVITYLHCSNNNRADTVFTHFKVSCDHFGTPSCLTYCNLILIVIDLCFKLQYYEDNKWKEACIQDEKKTCHFF